jgi:outer membrane protein
VTDRLPLGGPPAARAEELKVGYVNVGKLFDGYERTQRSDAVLEQKGKQKEAQLEGRINELQKLRESLELLNEEAHEARRRDIEMKADELQRFRQHTAQDLRQERDAIAQGILADIQRVVREYGKANGFSLIIDERLVLYGQAGHDVTDEVLKLLNQQAAKPR